MLVSEVLVRQRIAWEDLPTAVPAAISARIGLITAVHPVAEGMNSALAAVVETAERRVFVKGIRIDHPGVVTQRREAAIAPFLGEAAPALLSHLPDVAGWDLLCFAHVQGRHPDYRPGSPDLPAVLDAVHTVSTLDCPDLPEVKNAPQRWRACLDNPAAADLFAGDALLHTDYNPANVLLTDDGPRLLDWAWPTRGAAFLDPACLLLRLLAAGHHPTDADTLLHRLPAWRTAPPHALDAFAQAQTHLWHDIATTDPQPWKRAMAAAAHTWHTTRRDNTAD